MDQDHTNFNVKQDVTLSPSDVPKTANKSKHEVDTTVQDLSIFKDTPNLDKFHKYQTTKRDTIYVKRSTQNRYKKLEDRAKKTVEQQYTTATQTIYFEHKKKKIFY
jgi:hypothetical protein